MNTGSRNKITEKELVLLLKKQDRPAQRALYEKYVGYLVSVCSRYIPENDRVKDILQDSFLRIFKNVGDFNYRGEGSLKAWMTKIVVNGALKDLRRKPMDRIGDSFEIPDKEEDPDPGVSKVPVEVMMEMIRKLPDGYRTVFNLYVFEEKSHKEIAKLLGIKENSSCSQYARARAMLAREITDYKKRMKI